MKNFKIFFFIILVLIYFKTANAENNIDLVFHEIYRKISLNGSKLPYGRAERSPPMAST